ncbi:hypothetical protein ABPG72_005642 [Tetrahymena utriculariae]
MKKFVFKKTQKSLKQKADIYNILSQNDIQLTTQVKKDVIFPLNQEVESQIDKLIDTLRLNKGVYEKKAVAIAANQVGLDLRFFLLADYNANPFDIQKRILTISNPQILDKSKETSEEEEGCLSIPEQVAFVTRPISILVEYQNIVGKKVKQEFSGLQARIFQHELDHLDGIHMLQRANRVKVNPLYIEYLKKQEEQQNQKDL